MISQEGIGPSAPTLVLVKGHPGSGKTSVARALARRLLWPVVDKDDARGPLHTCGGVDGVSPSLLNALSYEIMFRVVKTQLECGLSVIVDCPFARKDLFLEAKGLARKPYGTNNDRSLPLPLGKLKPKKRSIALFLSMALTLVHPVTPFVLLEGIRQSGAQIMILECETKNEKIWKSRLEARAAKDEATTESHKPQSWEALKSLLESYKECWKWSDSVASDVMLHRVIDTSGHDDLDTIVSDVTQEMRCVKLIN